MGKVYLTLSIRQAVAQHDRNLLRAACLQNLIDALKAEFPDEIEAAHLHWKRMPHAP